MKWLVLLFSSDFYEIEGWGPVKAYNYQLCIWNIKHDLNKQQLSYVEYLP